MIYWSATHQRWPGATCALESWMLSWHLKRQNELKRLRIQAYTVGEGIFEDERLGR